MTHFLYHASLFVILITYLLLLYVGYLLFYPVRSFKVMVSPTPVTQKSYHFGDVIEFTPTTCRYNDNDGSVNRVLRNVDYPTIAYGMSDVPLVSQPFKCAVYRISLILPNKMIQGRYIVENYISIKTNALRTEHYKCYTESFSVMP